MKMIILRTHYYCPHWHAALKLLRDQHNIQAVILADMTQQQFEYSGFEHILFTDAACLALGLGIDGNYRWRCGDYCYYLAYQKYSFSQAWLIESDVFIPEAQLVTFFSQFDQDPTDFICSYYQKAGENWFWRRKFPPAAQVYACFMPVTRLTGNRIPELIEKRALEGGITNDESFLATTLTEIATVKDFTEFSDTIYDNLSFCYQVPKWRGGLLLFARLGWLRHRLYHPVVASRTLFSKYAKIRYCKAIAKILFQNLFMKNKYENY